MFGSISITTINADGRSVTLRSYSSNPWGCCGGLGSFTPGCFGFGFNPVCSGGNPFMFGAGFGLGTAAGMALMPALPGIFKGIGKGCAWLWNNALSPAFKCIGKSCSWLWNKAIVPAAKGVWTGVKAVGKGIVNAAKWVGKGIKNLFHKKS